MSALLIETKKRIKSTQNTKKITKAMYLESSAKMKQFQDKALLSRNYAWELLRILGDTIKDDTQSNKYLEKHEPGKTLFLLYTTDKGLCGNLNSRLIKTLFTSKLWKETNEDKKLLMTIGKKSYEYAKFNDIPVERKFESLPEKMSPIDSLRIVDVIVDYWTNNDIEKVIMIAPHYKNSLVFYPVIKTYLPLSKNMVESHLGTENYFNNNKEDESNTLTDEPKIFYEPDEETFREIISEQIVQSLFLQSFLELKATEYSNRAVAMKNATDAADDMIDSLTLNLNKARQAAITQEIAEIMAGSTV